jgi:hypothetical protein
MILRSDFRRVCRTIAWSTSVVPYGRVLRRGVGFRERSLIAVKLKYNVQGTPLTLEPVH